MLEMSAAKSPALALPGAVTPAVPAVTSADGAQIVDFSMVLAGATLAGETPAMLNDMLVQPEADAPLAPEPLPHPATLPGKTGASGNASGKNLPAGKLPTARLAAVTDRAPRKLRNEGVDLTSESTEATPEQDTVIAPVWDDLASLQTAVAAPALTEPTPPTIAPAPETASNLAAAAPEHDAIVPQATTSETAPTPQQALTKPQSRSQAKTQPQLATANADGIATRRAAKLESTKVGETGVRLNQEAAVRTQQNPLGDGTRVAQVAALAPLPNAAALTDPATSRNQGTVSLPAPDDGAQTPAIPAAVAQPAMAPEAIAPETGTPATITQSPGAAMTLAPIVDAPQVAPKTSDPRPSSLLQDAEPVATPRATTQLTQATITTLLAQTAPSALIQAAVPSPVADLPSVEMPAGSGQVATATLPAAVPSAEVSATPQGAATPAATLPSAKPAPGSAPTSRSEIATPVTPTNPAQMTPASLVVEPVSRPVTEALSVASPIQLAPKAANTFTPPIGTPTSAPLAEAVTIGSPTPLGQDRSPVVAPAAQSARIEAATVAPVLAASDKDQKAAGTIASVAATEAPVSFARPQLDASALAAEFRSAPSSAAPTTLASPDQSPPTQDIAALVDRITEARAAASPHTIRASLVHEDFGAVSVNLRTEASHIHVTLGSVDPGFAPAVQAAAAASLAGNTGDDAQNRRDVPAPQSGPQPQDGARNDASSQQQQQQQAQRERANGGERQPSRQTPGGQPANSGDRASTTSASQRRSGIYA